jgi:hypothetical protein
MSPDGGERKLTADDRCRGPRPQRDQRPGRTIDFR